MPSEQTPGSCTAQRSRWIAPTLFLLSALLQAQDAPLTLAYQLTHSETVDPSLSPDGKRMVYITVVAGKEQLFAVNLDGSNPAQLTRDDANHEDPAWSPDGKKIAFVFIKDKIEQIHLMNPDGSGVEPLTPAGLPVPEPGATFVIFAGCGMLRRRRRD